MARLALLAAVAIVLAGCGSGGAGTRPEARGRGERRSLRHVAQVRRVSVGIARRRRSACSAGRRTAASTRCSHLSTTIRFGGPAQEMPQAAKMTPPIPRTPTDHLRKGRSGRRHESPPVSGGGLPGRGAERQRGSAGAQDWPDSHSRPGAGLGAEGLAQHLRQLRHLSAAVSRCGTARLRLRPPVVLLQSTGAQSGDHRGIRAQSRTKDLDCRGIRAASLECEGHGHGTTPVAGAPPSAAASTRDAVAICAARGAHGFRNRAAAVESPGP